MTYSETLRPVQGICRASGPSQSTTFGSAAVWVELVAASGSDGSASPGGNSESVFVESLAVLIDAISVYSVRSPG